MLNDIITIRSLGDIRLLYFKYKDTPTFALGIIFLIALIGIMVIGKVVVPQLEGWFSLQKEVTETKDRIALMEENQRFLDALSITEVNQQYDTAISALPYSKDYTGVITTIDAATILSGLQRDDYSFEVGNLSTKSAELSPQTAISVKITFKGEIEQLQKYVEVISKRLPLSEVVSVSYNAGQANLEMNFFYKFIPDDLQIPYTDPIRTLTPTTKALLRTIGDWKKETDVDLPVVEPELSPDPEATTSGI